MRNIMDLIADRSKPTDTSESSSTTLAPVEPDAPVIVRLEAAVGYMLRDILSSEKTSPKTKFFMKKILDEAMEELREAPPEKVTEEFLKTTAMFYWVSTGQVIIDHPMPDGFWDHVGMIPDMPEIPAEIAIETPKELEAGVSNEA
jgi:hypothetical protein